MSRNTGIFNFGANLEVLSKAPLDAKQLVGTKADLTGTTTWEGSGQNWLYNGAIVAVGSDPDNNNNGIYFLSAATYYTDINSWVKVGGGTGNITGGTNGLSTTGISVVLGGNLNNDTTIEGLGLYGINYNGINNFKISPSGTTNTVLKVSDSGIQLSGNSTTITFNDNGGFKYGGDYSGNFTTHSLIDKNYADNILSGLRPKASVKLATTTGDGDIDLTGGTFGGTIDGVAVIDADRVLVKNQTSGIINGIYDYSGGSNTFTRSTDFDGVPSGEVVSGMYMWVLSGDTNNNTSWVLATEDPIVIDVTDLNFVYFNNVLDVVGGTGITVNTSSGNYNISVDGASLAGESISWTGDAFNVDVSSGNLNTALSNKLDTSIFNSFTGSTNSIINTAITGGTNGLSIDGRNLKLGGVLSEETVISGNSLNMCFGDTLSQLNRFAVAASNIGFSTTCFTPTATDCTKIIGGDLTIELSGNSGTITDTNSRGIRYTGDYSANYTSLSIPNAGWVTGLTLNKLDTSIFNSFTGDTVPIINASVTGGTNGLTNVGSHQIRLGGILTQSTSFTNSTSGTYGVCFGTSPTTMIDKFLVFSDDVVCLQGVTKTAVGATAADGISTPQSLSFCRLNSIILRDDLNLRGIQYANDYSSNFTARSLVDKGYVDSHSSGLQNATNGLTECEGDVGLGGGLTGNTLISGTSYSLGINVNKLNLTGTTGINLGGTLSLKTSPSGTGGLLCINNSSGEICQIGLSMFAGVTGGTNGLSATGQDVGLGGALTGDTTITTTGYDLNISNVGSGVTSIEHINGTDCALIRAFATDVGGRTMMCATDLMTFCFEGSAIFSAPSNGWACYATSGQPTTFTANAIPNVAYVTGLTSGAGFATANNGLCSSGQVVSLGGTLTGDTTISGDTNDLTFNGLTNFNTTATNIGLTGAVTVTGAILGTSTLDITGATTLGGTLMVTGNTNIVSGTLDVGSTLTLDSVGAGSTNDDVLTVTSGGEVQKISSSSLGENNNSYTISGITANTTLDNTYYTVLADSTGGAFTINLPAAPNQGQAYKIKDAGGDALNNNITISGNGNNIDGEASATINTDYGAFEVIYDTTEDAWFVLSFVN